MVFKEKRKSIGSPIIKHKIRNAISGIITKSSISTERKKSKLNFKENCLQITKSSPFIDRKLQEETLLQNQIASSTNTNIRLHEPENLNNKSDLITQSKSCSNVNNKKVNCDRNDELDSNKRRKILPDNKEAKVDNVIFSLAAKPVDKDLSKKVDFFSQKENFNKSKVTNASADELDKNINVKMNNLINKSKRIKHFISLI